MCLSPYSRPARDSGPGPTSMSVTARSESTPAIGPSPFRHVNVALVNVQAMFTVDLGVDVWEAIDAASTKPFGFMPFTPGPGVGGHCLPVDPTYLSWSVEQKLGLPFRIIDLANDVNDHMPDYVVRRAGLVLNRQRLALNWSRVLVPAWPTSATPAFAASLPDLSAATGWRRRASRSVPPIRTCLADQFPRSATPTELTGGELDSADLIVVTDHDCFDRGLIARTDTPIFDTRHRLPPLDQLEYL